MTSTSPSFVDTCTPPSLPLNLPNYVGCGNPGENYTRVIPPLAIEHPRCRVVNMMWRDFLSTTTGSILPSSPIDRARARSSGLGAAFGRSFLLERDHLALEIGDLLEVLIDAREPHVGHLIQLREVGQHG